MASDYDSSDIMEADMSEDTSEWPAGMQMMQCQSPILKQSNESHCVIEHGKRPYAGEKHGQLRWLALTPSPLAGDAADSFEDGRNKERSSAKVGKQQSVLFTDDVGEVSPGQGNKALDRLQTKSASKLLSGSNWDMSSTPSLQAASASAQADWPIDFSSLLGSVVTKLQDLTVSVYNLNEWHEAEQSGQSPRYHSNTNITGHDAAILLNRLSFATSPTPPSRDLSRKSMRSAFSHESSLLNSSIAAVQRATRAEMNSQRLSTIHAVKSSKSSATRRSSVQSAVQALEQMDFFLRDAWLEYDGFDLFQAQQVVMAGNVKSLHNPRTIFRRHQLSGSSAVSGLNRSGHKSSSFRIKDSLSSKGILHPQSLVKFFWDNVCLCVLLYDMFTIPLQAFSLHEVHGFQEIEWAITLLWTVDIFMTLSTGYLKGTRVILNRRKVFMHYVKTWMIFDILLVGLDWFARLSDGNFIGLSNFFRARCASAVRAVRAARIGKVRVLVRRAEDYFNSNFLLLGFGMAKLTMTLLIMVHFVTCIWYAIGESDPKGWTSYYNQYDCNQNNIPRDRFFWYFASSRWTLAQINGRTDIDENRTLLELSYTCLVAVLFAALFMSIFVSSITSTMVELSAAAEMETTTGKLLNEYLAYYQVPKVLVEAARRYIRESKHMEDESAEVKLLAGLPKQLASDLVFAMHHPIMVRNAFFDELNDLFPRVMRQLCSSVISNVQVHKWEMVYDFGDPCTRMRFVEMGKLVYSTDADADKPVWEPNYADPDSKPPDGFVLERGAWVSEASLWMEWKNHGRCIACARSTLLEVDADKFADLVRDYRDLHSKSCSYARKFLDLLMNQEVISDIFVVELTYDAKTDHGSHSQITHNVSSETGSSARHGAGSRNSRSDFTTQFSNRLPNWPANTLTKIFGS